MKKNTNWLFEQKKAGEEGPFNKNQAEVKEDSGYTCRFDTEEEAYFCKKSSSGGGGTGSETNTPFKSQTTGDKFREWVIDKTEFEVSNPKFARSNPNFNSSIMKKAWKEHGQAFINSTKYDPKTDTFPSSPISTSPKDDTQQSGNTVKTDNSIQINCDDKWEGLENYFVRDFGDDANKASIDFMDYYVRLYPSQFVDGGVFYNKCGVTTTPPYIQGNEVYKNALVKHIATLLKRGKKEGRTEMYNIFFNQYKGSKSVDNNVSDVNQNQSKSTELQVLFTKGDGIKRVLDRNEKPTRKACKDLIKFYENSYNNHYGEKEPSGYTRERFKIGMNNTKYAIFYCMKNHPFLSLDTKIEKFSNVTNRDWRISLNNYSSNIIKENMGNNIKQSLRQRLVETKLVKSLKTEIHAKALDSMADDFYGKNYRQFFNRIFEHTKTLQNSKGFINEDVTDSFQKAFNTLFYGNESKMKEQTIGHILRELKVDPNSEIGVEITNELTGVPDSDVTKLLSDPTFVADKIVSAINKSVKIENVDDDSLESILRSTTVNKLKSTMDDVKFKIASRITNVLDSARQNVESTSDEIKQSFIEKLSNKIAGI